MACYFCIALFTLVTGFVAGTKERVFPSDSDVTVNKYCQTEQKEKSFEIRKFISKQFVHHDVTPNPFTFD